MNIIDINALFLCIIFIYIRVFIHITSFIFIIVFEYISFIIPIT